MTSWHGGKGSKRRPEDRVAIASNWDRIFAKSKRHVYCKVCKEEVSSVRAGDETLDYCNNCECVVEGSTCEVYGDDND